MSNFLIIDHVFPKHVLDKIDRFYKTAPLKYSNDEGGGSSRKFITCPISLKELISEFEADFYIGKHIKDFNKNINFNHLERFYINVMRYGDEHQGHEDIPFSALGEDEEHIVALVYINPHCNGTAGTYIKDEYIEDKYNRMVIFNGYDWHRAEVPQDDLIRLSLYCNFTNRKNKNTSFKSTANLDTYAISKILHNVYVRS